MDTVDADVAVLNCDAEDGVILFDLDRTSPESDLMHWIANALSNHEKSILEAVAYHHRNASADVAKMVVSELRALGDRLPATATEDGSATSSTLQAERGKPLGSRASEGVSQDASTSDEGLHRQERDLMSCLEIAELQEDMERGKAEEANEEAEAEAQKLASSPAPQKLKTMTSEQKLVKSLHQEKETFAEEVNSCCMELKHDWKNSFDLVMGVVVLVNAAILAVELQMSGMATGRWFMYGGDKPEPDATLQVLDQVFMVVYIIELLIRLMVMRLKFFCTGRRLEFANVFDMLVVVSSIVEAIFKGRGSTRVLRLIRPLKIIRVLRCVRVMTLFQPLRILATSLVASLGSLCWSMVLLGVFMTMAGLILTALLQDFIMDDSLDQEVRIWLDEKYGTSVRSVWTMFQATLSGGWPNYAVPMVQKVNFWFIFFWLVYVVVVIFAVIRIISALFLKETLAAAASDAVVLMQSNMKQSEKFASRMLKVFQQADVSGDGYVSREEFMAVLETPVMKQYLHLLELEIHEANEAFDLLDDGDNLVSYDEFLRGLSKLKGHARSLEVMTLVQQQKKLSTVCADINARCADFDRTLQDLCKSLCHDPSLVSRSDYDAISVRLANEDDMAVSL